MWANACDITQKVKDFGLSQQKLFDVNLSQTTSKGGYTNNKNSKMMSYFRRVKKYIGLMSLDSST